VTYAGQPGWVQVDAAFESWDEVLQLIHNKTDGRVARPLNEANPYIDAQLPDGSRLHAIMAPLTVLPGPQCTVRRFRAVAASLDDLVVLGHSSQPAVNFLRALVKARRSLVVIGGTASGKTTFIQACLSECGPQERIITCEDTPELKVPAPLWTALVTKDAVTADRHDAVDMANLVRQTLRMRPDRIIIGEVRDGAMGAVLQAGNTGHDGLLFTVHANDPQAAIQRMETLALMYPPMATLRETHIRRMITTALHYVVHVGQVLQADGRRTRKLLAISEIRGIQGEDVYMEDIFRYDPKEDEWCRRTGLAHFSHVFPQLEDIQLACPAFDFRRDVVEREAAL
jgi:pilus assembly protein CpaF